MSQNSPAAELNDLLITHNFDVQTLDAATGKPPVNANGTPDPNAANMFSFDWVATSGKNYGTVVILMGADNNFEVYFGDNIGRAMESDDRQEWYSFIQQLRQFAKRNLLRYDLQNLNRLKYTMQGMAAVKESIFESFYGNRKVSYSGAPTDARLMIKHSKPLDENDARFRYVESLFIETADGERFKLPFRKLAGGRAMLEHVRQGGNPYDLRGLHIVEMVNQINTLGQFRRAQTGRVFEGDAADLINEVTEYYQQINQQLKDMSKSRGYQKYFESWKPAEITNSDMVVEDIKNLFVETRIDPRIEQALPLVAKISKGTPAMKEADIFENWIENLSEGTWALPDTPEKQEQLKLWMSKPQPVGPDAVVANELYDLIGDDDLFAQLQALANEDPDADAVPVVKSWIDRNALNFQEIADFKQILNSQNSVAASDDTVKSVDNDSTVAEADNMATFERIRALALSRR